MRTYTVSYTDTHDPLCPTFTWRCRAYSAEHAEEKFFDQDDFDNGNEGWKVLTIEREKKRG